MIGALGRLLIFGLAGTVLLGAYAANRIWSVGATDEQRPAAAIVVLGAAQYDGRPSPVFRARLDHAVSLYLSGVAPVLIVTGGKAEGDRTTEAATARAFAITNGVPARAILMEDVSRSTIESLEGVSRLMRDNHLGSAIFVSDPTHMLRVLRIARDQGIRGWGSPTPSSPIEADGRRHLEATARELGALAIYFLTGSGPPESVEPPGPGQEP